MKFNGKLFGLVVILFFFQLKSERVTQTHFTTETCSNIYIKREYTKECIKEAKLKIECKDNFVQIKSGCDENCENCQQTIQSNKKNSEKFF